MKNWEKYKDKLLEMSDKDSFDCKLRSLRHGTECTDCNKCRKKSYNWLYEDVEIKLYQWEYDLIRTNDQDHRYPFNSFKTYKYMKECGYFKGIYDISMSLKDILENARVFANNEEIDYEE